MNVLDLAKDINKKLIYASSSSVYGHSNEVPLREDFNSLNPGSIYGTSKKINEELSAKYCDEFDMNIIGLRFFTVYGSYGRPDMAYYMFTKSIQENKEISIFNKGKVSRDMTHVEDICSGITAAINLDSSGHHLYNLGNEEPISVMKLVDKIEKFLNKKAKIKYIDDQREVLITHACLEKSRNELSYAPKVSFENGMNEFLEWYSKY
jgi:UDP-glucuronate 4-epimerase